MQILNREFSMDSFWSRLREADKSLLILDYDGTLAPFVAERDKAFVYPGVEERLKRLQGIGSIRVVVVSGRSYHDLAPLLKLDPLPEIWGCHGAERHFPDGRHHEMALSDHAREGLEEAQRWASQNDLLRYCEIKPTSVAFHWRGRSESETNAVRQKVLARWRDNGATFGLELRDFDGGLELRAKGITKGLAVREIMEEVDPSTPLAYLGDDHTDEDAFSVMRDDQLKVLVRAEPRNTSADIHLTPPRELLEFLDRWSSISANGST